MRIGFYLDYANMKAGGIFTYSVGLLKELLKSDEIENVVLFFQTEQKEKLSEFINHKKVLPVEVNRNKPSFKYLSIISFFLYNSVFVYKTYLDKYFPKAEFPNTVRKIATWLNPLKKIIEKQNIEVLHVPFKISPIYEIDKPVFVTLHDVQELHFPEFFTSQQRLDRALAYKIAIDQSDHIVVSFNHVKKDLIKYFNTDNEKVSVCRLPLKQSWFANENITSLNDLKNKYLLKENFILYPAATWQHKNHIKLLEAVKILADKNIDFQLICTGNKTEHYTYLENFIVENNLENKVKFLGIVPEEDLIGLYSSTKLCVIPTLYEAGSGPLFEAMRYKSPVICSNVTSLPETIMNNDFIFDPIDHEDIANKILLGLTDDNYRETNLKNSESRMEYFKSLDTIKDFTEAYDVAIKKFHKK
jgi:glycosyltransferase involved in cell wall biosynthesis